MDLLEVGDYTAEACMKGGLALTREGHDVEHRFRSEVGVKLGDHIVGGYQVGTLNCKVRCRATLAVDTVQ